MFTLEHIDPRNSPIVSGLRNELNEIIADASYNFSKAHLFVPYRTKDYAAPVEPGDMGEFLIRGEWVVTEFYGDWWLLEAKNILLEHSARGGPKRVNWEERILRQELEWNCSITVCSQDGRLRKNSIAVKTCPHEVSDPKPLWFFTNPRTYCCRTHQNRSLNEQKQSKCR